MVRLPNVAKLITSDYFVVNDNEVRTTSLKVASAFGKRHSHILDKVRRLSCSEEFRSANFSVHPYINPQNGETYELIEMTKDGFMFLVMGFTGKKAAQVKEEYISEFNHMADQLGSLSRFIPSSFPEALRLAANQQEEIEKQKAELLEFKPKVEAMNLLEGSKDWYCITTASKMLKMRRIDLTDWMYGNGWIYKRSGNVNWQAYASKVQPKYLSMKPFTFTGSDGFPRTKEQVMITAKGLVKIAEMLQVELED